MPEIQRLDRAQAEQERLRRVTESAPRAYEDQYMSAEAVAAEQRTDAVADPEPQGLRSWMIESRWGAGESSGWWGRQRATEWGLRTEYRQQTLNHGEIVLQADGRSLHGNDAASGIGISALGYARDARSTRVTLRNIGFPLSPQVFADSAVGDLYSEQTVGLSRNYRLTLGSSMVRGLATRVYGPDFDLRAGYGQRGHLAGGPYPGFERSAGTMGWLGYTQRFGEKWHVAGQLSRAQAIPIVDFGFYAPMLSHGRKDVNSWAAAVGYGGELRVSGDWRWRLTAIGSHTQTDQLERPSTRSNGLFLEASARLGRARHEFGAYRARPELYFGDAPLIAGNRGAYWRMDHSSTRLNWGLGLDHERTAATSRWNLPGYLRNSVSGNFQYLMDRRNAWGGSLYVYQTRYASHPNAAARVGGLRSLYGQVFYQTQFLDWPRSRLSLTLRKNEQLVLNGGNATGHELQWEQDWIHRREQNLRPELSTTLGYAQDRSSGSTQHYPTAGVQLRYWLDSSLHVAGNLRYTSRSGGLYTSRGLSGMVSAEKDLGGGWRLGLATTLNLARAATTAPPAASAWIGPQVYRSNDKTAYIFVRWEGSTGRPHSVVGAGAGTGSGSVAGRVFFDANRDGQAQIGEAGTANVEVLLDGRYRAITDRDGRFEFPMVGTGHHRLTLTLDSVPLPWGVADDAGVSVHVPLRGQATAEIPVVKVGE